MDSLEFSCIAEIRPGYESHSVSNGFRFDPLDLAAALCHARDWRGDARVQPWLAGGRGDAS